MVTTKNRSRCAVSIKHCDDLYQEFPFNKIKLAS